MTPTSRQQAGKAALIWEFSRAPVENASVGIGLWMALELHWITVGSLWLVAFVAIDFVVRCVRYRRSSADAPGVHALRFERSWPGHSCHRIEAKRNGRATNRPLHPSTFSGVDQTKAFLARAG
jgi:hypothetical protein